MNVQNMEHFLVIGHGNRGDCNSSNCNSGDGNSNDGGGSEDEEHKVKSNVFSRASEVKRP